MKILPDAVLRYAIALFPGIPHPELRQTARLLPRILSNLESDARAYRLFQSPSAHASLDRPGGMGFEWGSLRAWPRASAVYLRGRCPLSRPPYVWSRAVVPPQNFGRHGAVVRIQVVEGYVDNVIWPVEKLARYRDFFTDYTNRIVADRPANIRTLERYLLLANDLPGLKFATTLKPSPVHPNASILIVEVKEKMLDGMARVDNRGSKARGPWEYLGSV